MPYAVLAGGCTVHESIYILVGVRLVSVYIRVTVGVGRRLRSHAAVIYYLGPVPGFPAAENLAAVNKRRLAVLVIREFADVAVSYAVFIYADVCLL